MILAGPVDKIRPRFRPMVVVGLPYTASTQMRIDEVTGGSPYGATTITGSGGERQPSENELELMRFQGRHVAELASKLAH